jgi:signal transduction histidine kinase/ActR/RegA family two-component response regulator
MQCEFCGGWAEELARTRNQLWFGCHDCQRSWKDDIQADRRGLGVQPLPEEGSRSRQNVSTARGLLIAVAAVFLAFAVRLALRSTIGDASPFIVFTPAVLAAAFYGGAVAGCLATLLSAGLGSHFFLRSAGDLAVDRWDRVALFLLVGALITTLSVVIRTARRRLAKSLWQEQKARAVAEAASQAKDEFLAFVSHELQTPASVVLGWANMLRVRKLDGPPLWHALEVIQRNARLQSKLVEDMLDTSRIVSGTFRFEAKRINLAAIVGAAIEQMRPSMEGRDVRVEVEEVGQEYGVVADPVRLQQVFTNLLSNAAKFTPVGGRISVAVHRTGSRAAVTVTDTGVGIAADFLPRVFERFEQDPATIGYSRRGLGLGLSICRHFIEQQRGTITAASDGPGKGTTFTVTLPLERSRESRIEHSGHALAPDALRSISILLIEDDGDTRTMLTDVLQGYGARVAALASATAGLDTLRTSHYDVALCDLWMPDMDGFAFIRSVRAQADRRLAALPAAAITASGLSDDQDRALKEGFSAHLQKPVDPRELAAAVLALARRGSSDDLVH